jgi:hypothetical protein
MQVAVGVRIAVSRASDVAVREHRAQDLVAPRKSRRRTLERIEDGRRLRQPGEQRRLRKGQMHCTLREIGLRRGFDPVRAVSVEHLVDVRLQDPALGALPGELDRETCLRRLAAECLRRLLDVEVTGELLRDRRAALDDVSRSDVGE